MTGRGKPSDRGSSNRGRGRGRGDSKPTTPQQAQPQSSPAASKAAKLDIVQFSSVKKAKEVKPSGHIVTGKPPGDKGTVVKLVTNYMPVVLPEGPFAQYDVKINPSIDNAKKAHSMLMKFKKDTTHPLSKVVFMFDGKSIMYTTKQLPKEILENGLIVKDEKTGLPHKFSITFTRAVSTVEVDSVVLQLYNNIMRRAITARKYQQFGRNFYNMDMQKKIDGYNLKVVPGLLSTLKGVSDTIMLNADVVFRALRTDTVLDFILQCQNYDPDYYKAEVERILPGTIVLCGYNNRTVPVSGIDWKLTPASKFTKNNAQITYAQYYFDHYKVKIKNMGQPLLVSEKIDKITKKVEKLYYVPELCFMTGITDDMREDHNLMKALKDGSGMDPVNRSMTTKNIIADIVSHPECSKLLAEWGVSIQPAFTEIEGRVLDKNVIVFGNNKTTIVSQNSDWQIRADPLYKPAACDNWAIVCTKGAEADRDFFLKTFFDVIKPLGMKFGKPVPISVDKNAYVASMEKALPKDIKFLLTILPNKNEKLYTEVKEFCCIKRQIVNQCVVNKTIGSNAKGVQSKVTKIAVQISAKLNGAPWICLNIKFPNTTMICGIDVYHSGEIGTKKKHSYVGFAASMNKEVSAYFSNVIKQDPGKEVIDAIEVCFLNSIVQFQKMNNAYPETIIIYRDGVGEGQIADIKEKEIAGLKKILQKLNLQDKVKVNVILVVKRINTRYFGNTASGLVNPLPGTVVDRFITEPNEAQEFFLVSQHVNQGSATPINYQVILSESNFGSNYLQDLTNKLCHMYFNWFGTIKVPAPCMYAHKIAFLIGNYVQNPNFKELASFLFYL